ncbi:hypothetical protein [Natrinema amylolyticum]|uniref:hypothetical protein n=1 Tax=Natrinema amylolyticum TaxID=2878679 RepID=UPI001CFBA644|nr:hypothetical protein [Natrinema amylolyticum]
MAADTSSRWSPEGSPDRWHLALSIVVATWAIWNLATIETATWGATAAGFVAFAIASGPIAASSVGTRVGARFREVGYTGRALVIAGFAVGIWGAVPLLGVSAARVSSFGLGGMLGVVAVIVVRAGHSHVARDA